MTSKIKTQAYGFEIEFTQDMTKSDHIKLCQLLTERLNIHYNYPQDTIRIVPEGITEGGLVFVGGKDVKYGDDAYKSMRYNRDIHRKWPWITNNIPELFNEWRESKDILFPKKYKSRTVLKAFRDAPIWTLDELEIFKDCMIHYGMIIRKMPKDKDLEIIQ